MVEDLQATNEDNFATREELAKTGRFKDFGKFFSKLPENVNTNVISPMKRIPNKIREHMQGFIEIMQGKGKGDLVPQH